MPLVDPIREGAMRLVDVSTFPDEVLECLGPADRELEALGRREYENADRNCREIGEPSDDVQRAESFEIDGARAEERGNEGGGCQQGPRPGPQIAQSAF